MKNNKIFSLVSLMMLILFSFTACQEDDNSREEELNKQKTMLLTLPSIDFHASIDAVKSNLTADGYTVEAIDALHLKATKQVENKEVTFIYTFDSELKTYQMAERTLVDTEETNLLITALQEKKNVKIASLNENEEIFTDAAQNKWQMLINKKTNSYIFLPVEKDVAAWGRLTNNADATGLTIPFLGKYAPEKLISAFELRAGHKLDATKTSSEKGYFTYNTGDERFPVVKYWLDIKTKTMLTEAAIFIKDKSTVTPVQVQSYLELNGFYYTALSDSEGSLIYYNTKEKLVAYVSMTAPNGADNFVPNIHFVYQNLDGVVPPETVDFPWPYVNFSGISIDAAVNEFKKEPYFKEIGDDGYGGALGVMVYTTSKDFPKILLMKGDNDDYFAAFLITDNTLVLRSPYVQKVLKEHGYEYKSVSAFPTFINKGANAMVQIDIEGTFGFPSIVFQPNEYPDALPRLKAFTVKK